MSYVYRDTSGQSWEVIVNTDGSLSTIPVSSTPTSPGGNTTVTVQRVVDYASIHTELMPIAGARQRILLARKPLTLMLPAGPPAPALNS